mmetsp:Transcript_17536/g.43104  ORF Transcript_17536/g.43104 Transcript_17536/m.43104 type:complete len:244 (-) Transcript_17536:717-1448(-)
MILVILSSLWSSRKILETRPWDSVSRPAISKMMKILTTRLWKMTVTRLMKKCWMRKAWIPMMRTLEPSLLRKCNKMEIPMTIAPRRRIPKKTMTTTTRAVHQRMTRKARKKRPRCQWIPMLVLIGMPRAVLQKQSRMTMILPMIRNLTVMMTRTMKRTKARHRLTSLARSKRNAEEKKRKSLAVKWPWLMVPQTRIPKQLVTLNVCLQVAPTRPSCGSVTWPFICPWPIFLRHARLLKRLWNE